MLTTAINKASVGSTADIGVSVRQLCALVTGAIVSAVVLREVHLVTPAVPLLLLAAAVVVETVTPPRDM
jgi:hypothetical protein